MNDTENDSQSDTQKTKNDTQKVKNDTQSSENDTQEAKDDTKNGENDTKNDTKNQRMKLYIFEANFEIAIKSSINDCFGKEK